MEIEQVEREVYRERTENKKTNKHPDVRELYRQRADLMRRLSEQTASDEYLASLSPLESPNAQVIDPQLPTDEWAIQIANVEREIKTITQQLDRKRHALAVVAANLKDCEARRAEIFDRYQEHQDIAESFRVLRRDYEQHRETVAKLGSLLTADENERAIGYNVVRAARPTMTPSSPKANVVLTICLLLGLIAGICGVLLAEIFDHSYHTTRQVTRSLGLAVFECIDEIVTAADRARMFRRRALIAPAVLLCLLAMVTTSNALAYLSLQRPSTYERVRALPERALERFGQQETGPAVTLPGESATGAPTIRPEAANAAEKTDAGEQARTVRLTARQPEMPLLHALLEQLPMVPVESGEPMMGALADDGLMAPVPR
jgi:hypothetical protein